MAQCAGCPGAPAGPAPGPRGPRPPPGRWSRWAGRAGCCRPPRRLPPPLSPGGGRGSRGGLLSSDRCVEQTIFAVFFPRYIICATVTILPSSAARWGLYDSMTRCAQGWWWRGAGPSPCPPTSSCSRRRSSRRPPCSARWAGSEPAPRRHAPQPAEDSIMASTLGEVFSIDDLTILLKLNQ